MPSNQKARLFCFTDFVLDKEFYDQETLGFKWCVAGQEIAPETKKIHWQGVIYFKEQHNLTGVIKKMKPRHVELCYSSADDNEKYCKKDGNVVIEIGDKPQQGKRTDLIDIAKQIKEGTSVVDIADANPNAYHTYGRTMNFLEDIAQRKKFRNWMTKGTWYWGKTGVGKSCTALEGYTPETHYLYPNDNGWWDGYAGQETVVINDFRGCIPYGTLLQLVDKWPTHVRRRCREPAPFLAKHVIITSALKPSEVYNNLAETDSLDSLLRRFEIIQQIS